MRSSYGILFCVCMVYSIPVGVIDRKPVIIIVSFDGFRYNYANEVNLPKINSLKADGSSSPYVINVFETKTYPNLQSFATGLYPESHGVISNSLYDPKYGIDIHYSAELYAYEGVIPIWTLNEVAGNGSHSGVMMWPGGEFPYGNTSDGNDLFKNKSILPTFYQTWNASVPWKFRVDTIMSWITHSVTPTNLVMLYFEEPDEVGHAFGPESDNVKEQLKNIDDILTYLCDNITTMNLSEIVNVILVSDHGMQTVTPSRIIDLTASVNTSLYRTPNTSPVLHIYPVEGFEEEVYKQLNATATKEAFKVYRKDDLPDRWHIRNSRRTPPIIAVADDGFVFQDFYRNIDYYSIKYNDTSSQNQTYGVHGYDNALDSMRSFFLAWGPLIKKGFVNPPFNAVDIFPLISKMLNLPSHPVNGTLENIVNILRREEVTSIHEISPLMLEE